MLLAVVGVFGVRRALCYLPRTAPSSQNTRLKTITNAIKNKTKPNSTLVHSIREALTHARFPQNPCLESSADNADRAAFI